MICLLVMTDGRGDCLTRTLASFDSQVCGAITRRVIHDDSGDADYRAWLLEEYPDFEIVSTAGRSGFGGAIANAWQHIESGDEPYLFHLEDDFTFNDEVNLWDLAVVLELNSQLAQIALKRQPVNPTEAKAGGFMGQWPDEFTDRTTLDVQWCEHRLFWTTNPALIPMRVVAWGWPDCPQSERRFAESVFADPSVTVGYLGHKDRAPVVHHIGERRNGVGY